MLNSFSLLSGLDKINKALSSSVAAHITRVRGAVVRPDVNYDFWPELRERYSIQNGGKLILEGCRKSSIERQMG
ncbi:hypothetical protein [Lentibacillus cibarius]|uniref:Uncharacterized protein n=1 Tax=Lentibacillus cibarius TaxID=2583219 RepID=A0A5S3R7D0_9BACI|nr:hypothetical protein [Lentibacillus cibarius]TMN21623.1 hypothetical protein FFL34_05495 [Lentibacillus cibarius]